MASPPHGSRSYSPVPPLYRQVLLYAMLPTTPPSPSPAPDLPFSPESPLSTLDAQWWSPNPSSLPAYYPSSPFYSPRSPTSPIYSPTSPIYSPTSPIYSPTSPSRYCNSWTADSPPSPSPDYCAVRSPTSPNYCPDGEFNNWGSHTSPAPAGSLVYCHAQTSPVHGNCSTPADFPSGQVTTCPGEFNDHSSPSHLLGMGSLAYSPTSQGQCPEQFNHVWEDITLADNVQTSASYEYCYCCSMKLQDCVCCQPSDDGPAA